MTANTAFSNIMTSMVNLGYVLNYKNFVIGDLRKDPQKKWGYTIGFLHPY